MMQKPLRVAHVITCLDVGGGNVMLYRLLSHTDRARFESEVVSLTDIGPIGRRIRDLGLPVQAIGMRRGVPNPLSVLQLAHRLQQMRPGIVQTWGYHADLVGGLAAKLAGSKPVVWGIHHATVDPQGMKRMTIWTALACARLSHALPTCILCCSESSMRIHKQIGYASHKMQVIPNGVDATVFRPDPVARQSVRRELGIADNTPLIGLIARFDPLKDHRNFLQAAAILHARAPDARFVLCGRDVSWENAELAGWADEAGIRDWCHLLGEREDVPRLTAALDIASTASFAEASPLVIAEAMACEVPCVVTDVGDSRTIVGETGLVVPPRNPRALADGWSRLLLEMNAEGRRQVAVAARQRVMERYSLDSVVAHFEQVYGALA